MARITTRTRVRAQQASASGIGPRIVTGSGVCNAQSASVSGVSEVERIGQGILTAQSAVVDGAGTVTGELITGTGLIQAQNAASPGSGNITKTGTGSAASINAAVTAAGDVIKVGTGLITAQPATAAGVGILNPGSLAGTLARDGVATPHQIALIVENPEADLSTLYEVRVREAAGPGTWSDWWPWYRVIPANSPTPPWGAVDDVCAWTVFGLQPGTTYDVELRKTLGATVDDGNISQFTTRALPAEPGVITTTIASGSTRAQVISALAGAAADAATAGEPIHVYIEPGTYDFSNISIPSSLSGASEASPSYITGAGSQTLLQNVANAPIFNFDNSISNLVIQDLDGEGIGTYSAPSFEGSTFFYSPGTGQTINNICIRRCNGTGFHRGIYFRGVINATADIHGVTAYDCDLAGTFTWNEADIREQNAPSWGYYGVLVAGDSHAFFNMNLTGFGDVFSCTTGADGSRSERDRAQFFYWNYVRNGGDDPFEFDDGFRNVWAYQCMLQNVVNAGSWDIAYGGPMGAWGCIFINPAETRLLKCNSSSSGMVYLCNTLVLSSQIYRTNVNATDYAVYYQTDNADIADAMIGNNVIIKMQGTPTNGIILSGATYTDRVDFAGNAWYPDGDLAFGTYGGGINQADLAAAQAAAPATPSGVLKNLRVLENDIISVIQPFASTINLPANSWTEDTNVYSWSDFAPNHASINSGGEEWPSITTRLGESFSGATPARGAVITGISSPVVGNRNVGAVYASDMVDWEVRQLTGSFAPTNGNTTMEDVTPSEWLTSDPGGTLRNVLNAWSGGDGGDRGFKIYVHGGGHVDSANNLVYEYDFSGFVAPRGWTNPADGSAVSAVVADSVAYTDGRPNSQHTYGGLALAEEFNQLFRFGGSRYGNGALVQDFWVYQIDEPTPLNRWTLLDPYPGNASVAEPHLFRDREFDKLIGIVPQADAAIFNRATLTWSSVITQAQLGGFDTTAGYDSTRKRVIAMNGSNVRIWTYDLSTDTLVSSSVVTFSGDTGIIGQTNPAIVYHENTDRFYMFGGESGSPGHTGIYWFDAADLDSPTGVVITRQPFDGVGTNIAATGFDGTYNGTYDRYHLDNDSGLLITLHRADEGPWLIKLPTV